MAQIFHTEKEIKLKIVYYGPALSGKTTNLIYVHQVLFPNQKVKLFSINTGDDRTLFFDLLPLKLGEINGYSLTLQLFTVPGQVRYNQTRRAVLNKADGVVFVADSQKGELEANLESLSNMDENLKANNLDPKNIPLVMQYNKQDLDNIFQVVELSNTLNKRKVPEFAAIAITGVGVLQTLKQSILGVLAKFSSEFPDFSVNKIEQKIDRSFESVLETYKKKTQTTTPPDADGMFKNYLHKQAHNVKVEEDRNDITQAQLLDKAVETNIEMAELYNELNTIKNQLEQKNRELSILSKVNQALTDTYSPEQLPKMIFKSILMTFETEYGSVLRRDKNGKLTELFLSGFNIDPIANIKLAPSVSLATHLAENGKPFVFNVFTPDNQIIPGKTPEKLSAELKNMKIMAFMSTPIFSTGKVMGMMNIYQIINQSSVLSAWSNNDLTFFIRMATQLSLAMERLAVFRKIKHVDKLVEEMVNKKTSETEEQIKLLVAQNRDYQHRLNKLENILVPVIKMDMRRNQIIENFKNSISKPFSSILTSAKILANAGTQDSSNIEKFAKVIDESANAINNILSSFEMASDNYFQDSDFVTEVFQITEIVENAKSVFIPVIEMKEIEWRQNIPENLPPVAADKNKIQFLLNQLIENSLQFTSSGFIELKIQYDPVYNDKVMVISLADSGTGIPKSILPRIFDRFFKETSDFGSSGTNFGLGLYLCKEIVEHYHGRIWAKSEEGVGSTFFVELPVKQIRGLG